MAIDATQLNGNSTWDDDGTDWSNIILQVHQRLLQFVQRAARVTCIR